MVNPYVLIPLLVWASAQLLKFILAALEGDVDARYLFSSGGMPSVHSAAVCSLATVALINGGTDSPIFGVTLILAAIVMYDSFGVRRASGEQAATINRLIEDLSANNARMRHNYGKLRELLGHKPLEVVLGAVFGIIMAIVLSLDKLGVGNNYLLSPFTGLGLRVAAVFFGVVVMAGWVFKIGVRIMRPGSLVWQDLAKKLVLQTQIIGWLGLFEVALMYEHAGYVGARIIAYAIIVILLFWDMWLFSKWWRRLPELLAKEETAKRRNKWLIAAGRASKRRGKPKARAKA